ncbi:MAG: ABC transporter permease subunit [Anaerolineae bacterium]|nr:ABC transporter permease subunit [Anaerolineae bacterium]
MNKSTPKAPTPQRVWRDDSAAIPRERSLMVAWWIAVVAAVLFIIGAALIWPTPYMEILQFVGDGLVVTFEITIVSMMFALVVGLFAGLGRTSHQTWINVLASFYVEVIRGIPLLAQLFWIYYALSRFVKLGPNVSAVVGLTICYGAYIAETFRAGIQSIPKGQMEAARALGLSRAQAMRYIIIPQAIRVVLPPVGNEFIAMLKDSSLVSVIAIADLLRRGREYATRTFAYFETYTMVALIYLLVTLIFSRVVFYIEEGMSRQHKDAPVTLMHRLAGVVVDFVVLDLAGLVVYAVLQGLALSGVAFEIIPALLSILGGLTAIYVLFFWVRLGRTPGMMAVGLRLINEHGQAPTLEPALMRLAVACLPLPGLSLLWLLGGRALPLHDTLAHTTVVRD